MELGQLIDYNKRNKFLQKSCRKQSSSRPLSFFKKAFYEVKANGLQLSFNILGQVSACIALNTNCIKVQGIDPEICSILTFQKRVWKYFLHHILCKIFQEKYFSCYILLIGIISLPGSLYFLRYWAICVLQLFVSQILTS